MNRKQTLILALSLATLWQIPFSNAEVFIVHGRLCQEEDPFLKNQDERMRTATVSYDVLEIGRGHLRTQSYTYQFPGDQAHTNTVCVDIFWKTIAKPLPIDAILILSNEDWEQASCYYVLAPVPWREILPYSPEAWKEIMKKTDAELIGNPLSTEMTLAVAEKSAIEKGASTENIYILRPREDAHRWGIKVFYYQNPYLYEYALWLNDRGDVLDESMPMINEYYKPGEDLGAFMSREYATDNRGIPFRLQDWSQGTSDPP